MSLEELEAAIVAEIDYHADASESERAESLRNAAAIVSRRAELDMWRPLTIEEAQAAYDAAEAVPMSEERIKEIVEAALDPATSVPNNEAAQMAVHIRKLCKRNEAMEAELADLRRQLAAKPQPTEHLDTLRERLRELIAKHGTAAGNLLPTFGVIEIGRLRSILDGALTDR